MILEVDNTTEQLIKELQNSIINTISFLNEGQNEIKKIVGDLELEFVTVSKEEQVQSLNSEISKITKKISQQGMEITEEFTNIGQKIEQGFEKGFSEEKFEYLELHIQEVLQKMNTLYETNNANDMKISNEIDSKIDDVKKLLDAIKIELFERVSDNNKASILVNKESERILNELIRKTHSEINEMLNQLMSSIVAQDKNIQDHVKRSTESIESIEAESVRIRNFIEKSKKIESLSEQIRAFEDQVKVIQGDLQSKLEFISQQANDVSLIERKNEKMLLTISSYLKQPGYKRFFKGMEGNGFEN